MTSRTKGVLDASNAIVDARLDIRALLSLLSDAADADTIDCEGLSRVALMAMERLDVIEKNVAYLERTIGATATPPGAAQEAAP